MNQIVDPCFSVSLENVRFFARHGVLPQERRAGNEFIVNVSITYFADIAIATSDSLEHTISYADLFELTKQEMETPADLLETVATRISQAIYKRWPHVTYTEISISKVGAPIPGFNGTAKVTLCM